MGPGYSVNNDNRDEKAEQSDSVCRFARVLRAAALRKIVARKRTARRSVSHKGSAVEGQKLLLDSD
jgi:hypothetical protein